MCSCAAVRTKQYCRSQEGLVPSLSVSECLVFKAFAVCWNHISQLCSWNHRAYSTGPFYVLYLIVLKYRSLDLVCTSEVCRPVTYIEARVSGSRRSYVL